MNFMARVLRIGDLPRIIDALREDDHDPEMQFGLFNLLGGAWLFIYPFFSIAWLGIWAALHEVRLVGHQPLVPIFVFGAVFCLAGSFDALWRTVLLWQARRGYRGVGGHGDDRSRHLLRIAKRDDGTILVQFAAGLAFAFYVWWGK